MVEETKFLHTTKKHKIQAYITIALAVLIIAGAYVAAYIYSSFTFVDNTEFDSLKMDGSVRPAGDVLTGITIPTEEDSDEMKQCAIDLFHIANYNLLHDSQVAYAIHTAAEVMGMQTGGVRYYVKNNNEYFNADYFYVPKGGVNGIIKAVAAESTNYGYMCYYSQANSIHHEKKAKELSYKELENGTIGFRVNWADLYFDQDVEGLPEILDLDQEEYQYCSYLWSIDTIKTAKVSYNENGYYEMVVTLDCSKEETYEKGLIYLQQGAGDENAKYTAITETIQIWDNGRYKSFYSYDEWYAPKAYGVFSLSSANDYRTDFYYDDYSLTIKNYQYAKDYIDSLS